MATITITIDDADLARVVDAYATAYGWTVESGLTKGQFTKAGIVGQLKALVRRIEHDQAVLAAAAGQEGGHVPPVIT